MKGIVDKTKRGISLIVLVITIIVMIILAAAIILSLNSSGIIGKANKAVTETNLKQIQEISQIGWAEAYADGKRTQLELETEVIKYLTDNGIDETEQNKYDIDVTTKGVNIKLKSIVNIVDTVPIPRGFVASSAAGENKKAGGLVIYEGTEEVNDKNKEIALKTRNQYVWIPVDSNSFETAFKRTAYTIGSYTPQLSNTLGISFWETVLDTTNMPLSTQDMTYMTQTTLTEIQEMYASVKKYGGFYVARYEMGIDTQRTSNTMILKGLENVHSKMNKIPYNYIGWSSSNTMNIDTGGTVEVARSLYPKTNISYGVVSTLIYGVQWDTIVNWYKTSNAVSSVTDSTEYGNYVTGTITLADVNTGAKYSLYSNKALGEYTDITELTSKDTATRWSLTTGALKRSKINNIYDMAGNMMELTMEGRASGHRGLRGGSFGDNSAEFPLASRTYKESSSTTYALSTRCTLYIK